ncbi:MAG: precorrin-3B C(17)-methyltransferase [Candidatus Scalindua sp.]|nr:precorrin-3B C(17)-methyltransferase [Candidatus Scalindua sp.]
MVGIGPGDLKQMSSRALEVLKCSECIVGYKTYINLIKELIRDKDIVSLGMRAEIERASLALEKVLSGKIVSVVSSGDPGVYGMAGLVLEVAKSRNLKIPIEIIPGIPSANSAGALLGAPLMHDYVVISLSDLLTPWGVIEKRLTLAAVGDFVIALYNPKSSGRTWQLEKAVKIMLTHKSPDTPVGIVKSAMRRGQSVTVTKLDELLQYPVDMTTIIIIGNSTTIVFGSYMVTKRGYEV